MTIVHSNPRSPSSSTSKIPLSSPSTLPSDITAPPRVVQKQVIQIKGHSKGCSIVLFLRLALPKSSKIRSFPLFPDEGVKLKSSSVYPVSIDRTGKAIIPNDASPGLKRASNILAIGPKATPIDAQFASLSASEDNHEDASRSFSEDMINGNKQAKPRITTSNFHITVVSPQTREHHEERVEKLYYLTVIHIEVGLWQRPPLWPYEAHIPIPLCLNNKLHFSTDEKEENANESFKVEFDPQLVLRQASKVSEGATTPDTELSANDSSLAEDDSMESDAPAAISGSFPATNKVTVRWARVGITGIFSKADHPPVRAESFTSEGHIIEITKVDEEFAQIKLRFHAIFRGCSFPGLDPIAALNLHLNSNSQLEWLTETLSIQSERSRTLHSWSTDVKEPISSMSRSSTSSSLPPSVTNSTSNGVTDLDSDTTVEDGTNLIDIQPPKGVVDVINDDTSFDNSSILPNSINTAILTPKKARKKSISSFESKASEYSQKSADGHELSLHLFIRNSAIRDANSRGEDLAFVIEGSIKTKILQIGLDESIKLSCPLLIAQNIPSQATLSSIGEDIDLTGCNSDEKRKSIAISAEDFQSGIQCVDVYKHPAKFEETMEGDHTADYSTSTVGFAQGRSLNENVLQPSSIEEESFEDLKLHTITSNDVGSEVDSIGEFSGIIEEVDTTAWITNGVSSFSKPRKVVHRIQSSWPRVLPPSIAHASTNALHLKSHSMLLPLIVFALPRTIEEERIEIMHVSVQGIPINVTSSQREEGKESSEGISSNIIDIPLPDNLRDSDERVSLSILYSVEGPATTPTCLFAPIASSVAYFHARIYDERLQNAIPILSYLNEPLSSSMQYQEQRNCASIFASMVPAMTKISLDYVERTKPLIPLPVAPPLAPLRRQSGTSNRNTASSIVTSSSILQSVSGIDPLDRSRSPSPSKQMLGLMREQHPPIRQQHLSKRFNQQQSNQSSHNRLITWTTFHAFITVLLATSLYNVIFNVLPSVQNVSRKVDVMGLALNIDFINDTPEILSSYTNQNNQAATLSSNQNIATMVNKNDYHSFTTVTEGKQFSDHNTSLSTSNGNLSDFLLWFSSTISWPLREILRLLGIS